MANSTNPELPDFSLGVVDVSGNDRLECIALQYGMSREEALGWVLGVGITILEIVSGAEDARVWVVNGDNTKRIKLPGLEGQEL